MNRDRGGPEARRLVDEMDEFTGRRWSTPTLVFGVLVALLLGAIAALLALPEDPLPADAAALQRAAAQTALSNDELQAAIDAQQADLAAKDAQIAQLQAAAAGDADAQAAALDSRSTALDEREAALVQREAAVAAREQAVAAAEAGGAAGITGIPGLGEVDQLQLPDLTDSLTEEQARGMFDRLIDRLRDIAGIEMPVAPPPETTGGG